MERRIKAVTSERVVFKRRLVLRADKALAIAGGLAAMAAPARQTDASEATRPVLRVLAVRPEKQEIRADEPVRISFELETPTRWHVYPAAKKPLLGKLFRPPPRKG